MLTTFFLGLSIDKNHVSCISIISPDIKSLGGDLIWYLFNENWWLAYFSLKLSLSNISSESVILFWKEMTKNWILLIKGIYFQRRMPA